MRVPEMSPNGRQQPTITTSSNLRNMRLARALNPRATDGNTLVMRGLSVPDRVGGRKVIIGHRCTIA
jgi:hypothetical protein